MATTTNHPPTRDVSPAHLLREASDALEKCRNARAPLALSDKSYLLRLELDLIAIAGQLERAAQEAKDAPSQSLRDAMAENRRAADALEAEIDPDSFEARRRRHADAAIQGHADCYDGAE